MQTNDIEDLPCMICRVRPAQQERMGGSHEGAAFSRVQSADFVL